MATEAKLISLGVLFIVSLLSGLVIPYFVCQFLSSKYKGGQMKIVLCLLNCFSGGVFVCTSLLSLLPEAREAMEEVTDADFPFTELLTVAGFFLILIIENVATLMYKPRPKTPAKHSETNGNNGAPAQMLSNFSDGETGSSNKDGGVAVSSNDRTEFTDTESVPPGQQERSSTIRDTVLMVALSIHMIFDGLGLGLLDEETKVWSVLTAVSIHRVPIFFSTGVTICSTKSRLKFTISMVYMAIVSVLGLGIAIAISMHGEGYTVRLLSAILQGLAVGTFLNVSILEILAPEFEHKAINKHKLHKVFSACLGGAVLALVSYFV